MFGCSVKLQKSKFTDSGCRKLFIAIRSAESKQWLQNTQTEENNRITEQKDRCYATL